MPAQEDTLVHPFESPSVSRKSALPKILGTITIVLILVPVGIFLGLVIPGRKLGLSVNKLKSSGNIVVAVAKTQDLGAVKLQLSVVESDLAQVRKDYSGLGWLKMVPFARNYYLDGQHGLAASQHLLDATKITVEAIAPYADLVGLKGLATTGDGAKTAQDRINFIVETLDKVKPQLAQIGEKLKTARTEADSIDPARYPQNFRGVPVRSQLTSGLNLLDQAATFVSDAKPLLESTPYILGKDKPRRYLVLFQNDAELRPTGGFMTGYAVVEVNKGKISTIESDDIYKLDERFPKRIPAPDPIKKYHPNVPYWYLRDQNLSPDFKVSMDTFFPNYKLTKSPSVDGIIAVDTQLLVDLLKVTGKIGVPGFGNFSAEIDKRCDCPSAFYEMQLLAGSEEPVVWDSVSGKIVKAPANYGDRKRFLGPIMYSLLANVMAQPKAKIPTLVDTILKSVQGKHILLYFVDQDVQKAVESFNLAGRVRATPNDYLYVVDTNFSGGKTNIWVKNKVDQVIEVAADGTVTKTVTLTYNNPQDSSVQIATGRRLNGLFRDWLRVYVPKGSQLIEAKGFETGQAESVDLDRTVFEGFFTLAPLNVRTVTLKYTLPFKVKSPYKILMQKQGGTKEFPYTIKINGKSHPEFFLVGDTDLSLPY